MERIDINLHYRSGYNNGWPLITVTCNNQWLDCFEASGNHYSFIHEVTEGPKSLIIEHWGKNPITDSEPNDKFFELIDLTINEIPCRKLLPGIIKKVKPTPWNKTIVQTTGDTYLGHNGTLEIRFQSPVKPWLHERFNQGNKQIQGQHTTREVLAEAKKFFKLIEMP